MINKEIINTKHIIIVVFILYSIFLTFKHLISIKIGFEIRVPHFLFGLFFVGLAFFILLRKNKLLFKEIWLIAIAILVASVLNHSVLNPYFTYLFIIIIISYSIFAILNYYHMNVGTVSRIIVYASLVHVFLAYFTIEFNWFGGFQMKSYSDFPTFFAMQLSIIFPLIHFIKKKKIRYAIMIIFIITIFLLAARGPLLALMLGYMIVYRQMLRFKDLIYIISLFIVLLLIVSILDYGLIDYFLMKINPFSDNYNLISDLNRWLYIVATLDSSFEGLNWLYGSGLKNNANIIKSFFENDFINTYNNFATLENATVHNVFLEIYSDLGIFVFIILMYVIYKYYRIFTRTLSSFNQYLTISLIVFIINYNLEPNYIHFFFWFFIFFYGFYAKSINNMNKRNIKNATSNS